MRWIFLAPFVVLSSFCFGQVPAYLSTDGLTAWYPMDGDVLDHSGNGFNGVEENFMQFLDADCDEGQYVSNDGDGSVILPSQAINFPNQLTIAYRFRLHSNEAATIFRHGQGGEMHSVYNQFNDDKLYYSIKFNDDNWYKASVSIPDIQEWCSVVATYNADEDSLRIYTNFGDEAAVATPTTGLWNYGIPTQFSRYIQGDVDDFAIWSREINDDERLAYLNAWCNACSNPLACNFSAEEACVFPPEGYGCDGSCLNDSDGDGTCDEFEVLGCLDPMACNFNADVTEVIDNCDYTCCPGPGCCGDGTYWDVTTSTCLSLEICEDDLDGDGVIGVNDLMQLLSSFGTDCPLVEPAEWTCGDPVSYHGYDYETVLIGEQCWFAENSRFIPEVSPASDYSMSQPRCHVYGYNGSAVEEAMLTDEYGVYGALYNFQALQQWEICPTGWHVPSDEDWMGLELTLGIPADSLDVIGYRGCNIGDQLKSESLWNGTNQSGMNMLPGGGTVDSGEFVFLEERGWFWSSTEAPQQAAWFRQLESNQNGIYRAHWNQNQEGGKSIRCIKD